MIAVILDMIPYAVSGLYQLVTDALGIVNTVVPSAQLYPPEVGAVGSRIVSTAQLGRTLSGLCRAVLELAVRQRRNIIKVFVLKVHIGPRRCLERDRVIGFAGFKQAGHAHSLAVGLKRTDGFMEFVITLAPHAVARPRYGCKY